MHAFRIQIDDVGSATLAQVPSIQHREVTSDVTSVKLKNELFALRRTYQHAKGKNLGFQWAQGCSEKRCLSVLGCCVVGWLR